jgi:hypothetical protein
MFGFNKNNNGKKRRDLEARIREEDLRTNSDKQSDPAVEKVIVKETVPNNGHSVVTEEKVETKPIKKNNNGKGKVVTQDYDDYEDEPRGRRYEIPEEEDKPDIPGKGFLYHAKDENLGEASRLNEREVLMFSLGDTQESIYKVGRKTVYATFRDSLLKYKIALEGKGREEAIELKTIESEKNASKAGQAFGGL